MRTDPRVEELLEDLLDSGNTPENVCHACPELLPQVRARWQRLRAVKAEVGALFPPSLSLDRATSYARQIADLPRIRGYEVQGVLGRGGMGVVYNAWHLRLCRPVAMKMLLAGPYAHPQELERFLREAETVAGLRHANIVQVLEAGDVEGRPYFTMEFVEGGSLAQKLAGTPQPARQAAALVAVVAEAVHAAHQRGVVHRDLKPGNILLTADGTPKLNDFGLARRLEGVAGLTQSGAPLGTPSYMAPEQAEGRLGDVGAAADTYALGAILYELLTGRPPFRAETAAETLHQVVSQDPVPPSRLNAAVPRDLETICLKCLEKDLGRRYTSAAALAEDLQRFQRNEPILALPVGPAGRALRWTRRHPTGAALAATALALVGLAIGGGAWLLQQRAERRAELRSEVGTAVAQAVSLRRGFHFHEARELLEQARQQLGPAGPDDVRRQVEQARDDLKLAESLDTARMRAATPVEGRFKTAGAESLYAEALYEETLTKAGLSPSTDCDEAATRMRNSAVSAEIVAALDDWASITPDPARRAWLLAVARGADPDPLRDRLRQPNLWQDGVGLAQLVKETPAEELSPQLATALGRVMLKTGGDAVPLLSAAQARNPQDFWLNFELGWALYVSGRGDEALGFYRAALALRPDASPAHNGVGVVLRGIGRGDEAISHYEKAISIDPDFAAVHNNLGLTLWDKGRRDDAISHYQHAIQLYPKGSAMAHLNLGGALRDMGRQDEAINHFQEAIRLDSMMSAKAHNYLGQTLRDKGTLDEAISHYQESIRLDPKGSAKAHNNLGLALWAKGRRDEALSHYQESIRLDPEKSTMAHTNLGTALCEMGRRDEGIRQYEEAIRIDPKRSALAHNNLGVALRDKGRLDDAISHYQESIRLDPKSSASAHTNLGTALRDKHRLDEAIGHFQEAIRLSPNSRDSSLAHNNLATSLQDKKQVDEAISHYREAIKIDPEASSAAHNNLGAVLFDKGRVDEAISHYRESIRLDPKASARAHKNLGLALWAIGREDEAISHYQEAIRLDPKGAALAHRYLGSALLARREWDKSADCFRSALESGAPEGGHIWFEYACALLLSGDRKAYEDACAHMVERCGKTPGLRAYHVARACTLAADAVAEASLPSRLAETELKSTPGQFWSLTEQGALLFRAGRVNDSVALFEQSLNAAPAPGRAVVNWLWLALAHQRLGETEEARRWFEKATAWLDQLHDRMPPRAETEFGLHLHNWLEAHVLRREAEALLGPPEKR